MIIAGVEQNAQGEEYMGAFVLIGSEDWVDDSINFCLHMKKLQGCSQDFLDHMDECIAYIRHRAMTLARRQ